MVNTAGVNLRTEPGTNAPIAGTTSKGTVYTVLTLKTVNGQVWYQVQAANGSKVWIASWLTEKSQHQQHHNQHRRTNPVNAAVGAGTGQ